MWRRGTCIIYFIEDRRKALWYYIFIIRDIIVEKERLVLSMQRENYITDEQVVKRANVAVELDLIKKKAMGNSIVGFDRKTQIIYQVNSDGTKIKVADRIRKGRYSERVAEKA